MEKDNFRENAQKSVLEDDSDEQYRQIWCEGYCRGAREQYEIDRNNALKAFDEFIAYLHESGRINLDDSENRDEWINIFNKFLKNTYGLEQ